MNIDGNWLQSQFRDLSGIAPLSRGGQKVVYAATHSTDGSIVLKIIHPTQDPERVRRELLAVHKTGCPRVPRVLASGELQTHVGEVIWVREQRIEGDTVRFAIKNGVFDKISLLRLAAHVLEALADAENAQIVHRDVKPDNIIRDTVGNFWLLDFGIARHLDLSSLTGSHAMFGVGTAGYAPPEQFRNRKREIDGRSDLFALGVTLYECATGTNPFREGARDDLEVLRNVELMTLPPITLDFDGEGLFASFVAGISQKRSDHRPATVSDALNWIREICDQYEVDLN
jgi:serine/threonine protein kinase